MRPERGFWLCGIFILLLILLFLFPSVSAQSDVAAADVTGEEMAGVTPDNILYGLDVFLDELIVFLTPDPLGKSELRLNIMQERMAEMEVMASRNKMEEMKKAGLEGQKQIELIGYLIKDVRPEDAPRLNESLRIRAEELEDVKQRLMNIKEQILEDDRFNVTSEELDESIADALEMIETSENVIGNIGESITDAFNTFMISSGPTSRPLPDVRNMTPEEREAYEKEMKEKAEAKQREYQERFNFTCNGGHGTESGKNLITGVVTQTEWCCEDSGDYTYTAYNDSRYYAKGTVQYKVVNIKEGPEEGEILEYEIHTDSCDGDTLTEWWCGGTERIYSESYECPDGCDDGACIDKEGRITGIKEVSEGEEGYLENCTDSDGGPNYFVKGTMATLQYNSTDFCRDNSTLVEFSCGTVYVGGDTAMNVGRYYPCPNGCQDGACI